MIGGGITNTLDLGGGQKIQDYLAGAGVSTQGPGGGTLYTQGQGFNPRPVIDTSSQQYQDLFEKYRPGFNEEYAGKMLGTQDRTYLNLPSGQDMRALGYYDPNPMTRIDKTPMMAEFMNNLYRQPVSGDANLGFGSLENPSSSGAEIGGVIPAMQQKNLGSGPKTLEGPINIQPEFDQYGQPRMHTPGMQQVQVPNPNYGIEPAPTNTMQPILTPGVDYDAQANPFGPQEGVMPELDNIGLITNAPDYNPVTPQQPTGGFDSKVFANELLTGIGDLFKQHFPESAQMAFNNSNQPQSQIEQPIQDATTFDVQPQQNTAYNPFSVNTIGGAFGGGY